MTEHSQTINCITNQKPTCFGWRFPFFRGKNPQPPRTVAGYLRFRNIL